MIPTPMSLIKIAVLALTLTASSFALANNYMTSNAGGTESDFQVCVASGASTEECARLAALNECIQDGRVTDDCESAAQAFHDCIADGGSGLACVRQYLSAEGR